MRFGNCFSLRCIVFIIVILVYGNAFSDESDKSLTWKLKAGGKGIASSGISEAYTYYSIYGDASVHAKWFEINVNGARDIGSQIASGLGEYQYIGINKASFRGAITPCDFFSAGGSYGIGRGDGAYTANEWGVFTKIGPDAIQIALEYGSGNSRYTFSGVDIEVRRTDASIAVDGEVNDVLSLDISYDRNTMEFSNLNYQYTKQSVRGGAFLELGEYLILTGGLSAGMDSADYVVLGGDAGAMIVFSGIKLSVFYIIEQYIAPTTSSTETSKKSSGSGGSSGGSNGGNPYIQSSKIGESFASQRLSVGVAYAIP